MTATREAPRRDRDPVGDEACAHCGSPLEPDQEWCVECGAARTLVHPPPSPGIAVAIVATVVLAALVALAIVLINLSTGANRELAATPPAEPTTAAAATTSASVSSAATAATSATTTTTTTTQTTSTSHSGATVALASWPVGLSGWTVILGRSASQASADALAEQLAANGLSVGVLDSSQHPRLPPGLFIVFSGRYPTQPEAAAAAATLRTQGQPQAVARQVAPPGGI